MRIRTVFALTSAWNPFSAELAPSLQVTLQRGYIRQLMTEAPPYVLNALLPNLGDLRESHVVTDVEERFAETGKYDTPFEIWTVLPGTEPLRYDEWHICRRLTDNLGRVIAETAQRFTSVQPENYVIGVRFTDFLGFRVDASRHETEGASRITEL